MCGGGLVDGMLKLTALSTEHDALLRKLTFEDAAMAVGELPPETLRCLSALAALEQVPAVHVQQLLGSPTPAEQPQVCPGSPAFVLAVLLYMWLCWSSRGWNRARCGDIGPPAAATSVRASGCRRHSGIARRVAVGRLASSAMTWAGRLARAQHVPLLLCVEEEGAG